MYRLILRWIVAVVVISHGLSVVAMAGHPNPTGSVDQDQRLPVVFVHGFNSSGCSWDVKGSIRFDLEAQGHLRPRTDPSHQSVPGDNDGPFSRVFAENHAIVNYGRNDCKSELTGDDDPSEGDFTSEVIQATLDKAVRAAHDISPTGYVDVVAHSMGGLVTRFYLNNPKAKYRKWVRTVVMIATPNHGSFGSLAVRLQTLFDQPEWHQLDQRRVDRYRELYLEYAQVLSDVGDGDPRPDSFFEFLASRHETEISGFKSRAIKEASGRSDRWTAQFEEFMALVKGKAEARQEIVINRHRDSHKSYSYVPVTEIGPTHLPGETQKEETPDGKGLALWGARGMAKSDPYRVAMDRLLPEYIPAMLGVDEDGEPFC